MPDVVSMLASFTAPVDIGTTPASMLWMFPLLAAIALVYKATKMRVLRIRKYLLESLLLFLSVSGFMIMAIIVLNLLSWLITG
jgi:DNA phosphorothioation-dependent restriction protein DptG